MKVEAQPQVLPIEVSRALAALKAVLRAESRVSASSNAHAGSRWRPHLLTRDWRSGDPDSFRRARRAVRALAILEGMSEQQMWREVLGVEEDED